MEADFKWIVDACKALNLSPPAIAAVLGVLGFCWLFKKFVDLLQEAGKTHRAKYDWLVESLGKPTVQQSRYLVEQAYARYLSQTAIDYDDLEALLKRKNPSASVEKFSDHRKFILIRHNDSEFEFRAPYASHRKRFLLRLGHLLAYFLFALAAADVGIACYEKSLLLTFPYCVILAGLVIVALVSLVKHTNLSNAMEFMEPGSQRFWPRPNLAKAARSMVAWLRSTFNRAFPKMAAVSPPK